MDVEVGRERCAGVWQGRVYHSVIASQMTCVLLSFYRKTRKKAKR